VSTKEFHALNDLPLPELFRLEVETQSAVLRQELLALRSCPSGTHRLEELMRASHSIKGAAQIVSRSSAVRMAHTMEDCFLAAQDNAASLPPGTIDTLLRGVDLLGCISRIPDDSVARWEEEHKVEIEAFLASLPLKDERGKRGGAANGEGSDHCS
jgi:two-component system, chemotaxis family, sensor histidine kinase and response regulator WspE